MKNISPDLVELPAQAIRCSLRGFDAEKEWTSEESANFGSLMDANTLKVN
jgi:hypothetical protein